MDKYIVVGLVGILSCLPFYNQAQPQFLNKSNQKFTVIAHRGEHIENWRNGSQKSYTFHGRDVYA